MKYRSKYNYAIFLISFATLLFELSLTRVFSVTLWYHFGFLIISTAMMGFGVSGVLLSLWRSFRDEYDADSTLGWLGLGLSASVVICFWLLQKIPFDPFSLYSNKRQLLYMPLTYIVVSIPFFFGGLTLSFLFTRFPAIINRLYAFDLSGAALGCIAIVFTMPYFGGSGSVLLAASIAACGSIVFFGRKKMVLTAISVLLVMGTFVIAWNADSLIPLHITANKFRSREKPVFTKWNMFSRIDLYLDSCYLSPEKKSPTFTIDQGTAATGLSFDLKPDVKTTLQRFPDDSLYGSCLAYLDKKAPSILIIGSGCGTEVVDALHFGAKKITAVEINPIICKVVRENEYWSDLFRQPQVRLVNDDGRNFVRSSNEKYDAIISVHTISNAAIASGALSLSENYVLTKEAFEDYYSHLTDSGVIYFTRPEFQLPRLFSTGREVLNENGITDVTRHFFAYTSPPDYAGRKSFYAVFVMSKKELSPGMVAKMESFMRLSNSFPVTTLYNAYRNNGNIYDSILTARNLSDLYRRYPFQISPATDNEPFFNHHTRWSSLNFQSFKDIFSQQRMGRMALEDKPIAEVSLVVLLLQVLVISAIFILLPLWKSSKQAFKTRKAFPYLVYFSGLGCGFIMIEITMIQLFSLLLGEPVYSFAIVLAALLLFTGVGAFVSGRYSSTAQRALRNAIVLLAGLLLAAGFFLPGLLHWAIVLPMFGRIILCVSIILPLGILMGIPFPSGIQLIRKESPAWIPWAWGVNGFFTVIGSVAALMLSMMVGFRAVLWTGAAIYALSMIIITRATKQSDN